MVSEQEAGETETAAFTQALASLKRRGSNLLVVGTANDRAHSAACHRLLGDGSADRRRVFVTTDRGNGHAEHVDDGDAVVEFATTTRSAAAAEQPTSDGPTLAATDEPVETLPELGRSVGSAIDGSTGTDTPPAALRLCFDSLRPLVEIHEERDVFRLLHAMTGDVRAARGMGHYHLPLPHDDTTVRTLRPLFDAVVEVRSQTDVVQQRWHLNGADITTDWLDL